MPRFIKRIPHRHVSLPSCLYSYSYAKKRKTLSVLRTKVKSTIHDIHIRPNLAIAPRTSYVSLASVQGSPPCPAPKYCTTPTPLEPLCVILPCCLHVAYHNTAQTVEKWPADCSLFLLVVPWQMVFANKHLHAASWDLTSPYVLRRVTECYSAQHDPVA
jgi:hypothetical protein